jgi:hypothetical protein
MRLCDNTLIENVNEVMRLGILYATVATEVVAERSRSVVLLKKNEVKMSFRAAVPTHYKILFFQKKTVKLFGGKHFFSNFAA